MRAGYLGESLRFIRLLVGTFIYAIGIVMTMQANLGFSPWDVFHQGLAGRLGISFGLTSIIVSGVIIAAVIFLKEEVGVGTLVNVVMIGVFIDLLQWWHTIPLMRHLLGGLVMMLAGLFVIALASYLYIGACYGAGPRDSLMVVLARRTGRPVGLCRAVVEGSALLFGWLLGGPVGIGTVVSAFGVGVAVQTVFSLLRFDVRKLRQEMFFTTLARWRRL